MDPERDCAVCDGKLEISFDEVEVGCDVADFAEDECDEVDWDEVDCDEFDFSEADVGGVERENEGLYCGGLGALANDRSKFERISAGVGAAGTFNVKSEGD